MLTMEEYDAMDGAEQTAAILQGDFLADREENGLIVQLYSVGTFYGELYYDPFANKILRGRAFEGTQLLGPYLAHIRFNARWTRLISQEPFQRADKPGKSFDMRQVANAIDQYELWTFDLLLRQPRQFWILPHLRFIEKANGDKLTGELKDFMGIHCSKLKKTAKGEVIKADKIGGRTTYYTDTQELFN